MGKSTISTGPFSLFWHNQRVPGGFPNITCWAISTASGPSTFGHGEPVRDGGLGEGPEEGACWDGAKFWWNLGENHGKTMGKPWENHGKILKMTLNMMNIWGKTWEKHAKPHQVSWWINVNHPFSGHGEKEQQQIFRWTRVVLRVYVGGMITCKITQPATKVEILI